ncbi:thiamine pyrophosphate-binding protein [Kineosporia sp. NBRC 101731]|uniref:alpha-keto acid decarboxylase family protein n=1 Tax=Kineosporia sp. NBRC 101731 TaxID=3032199 RepID=UPI0024A5B414|nr:thiamine pyrophosphate-binding protein [Kineosporia sp. NBRC 101731]GLY32717.1 alpha-keto-acid decarboxylase [Kineosporia sp. NBRC 101731]
MTEQITLAEYLGHRLRQAGVGHLFGVPGDFNLTLLDHLTKVPDLQWTGSPNELNAGYAADAYARSRGLAALVTTYGVGELSAFNAVAGSAAEDVPVVHIVGSPSTATVAQGRKVHHTLADGVFDRFSTAFAQVVVHQETVTADRAAEQIDAVLLAATTHRRPTYLSIPMDLATLPLDAQRLNTPLRSASDPAALRALTADLTRRLAAATKPVFVVGHLVPRFDLSAAVLEAARAANIPLVTSLAAKGAIDASQPLHRGHYAGTMVDASTAALVAEADLVVELGTVASDVLTGFFTHRAEDVRDIHFSATRAGGHEVLFTDAVRVLAEVCATVRFPDRPYPARPVRTPVAVDPDDALTQESLWQTIEAWLPSGTAVLADTGTAYFGSVRMNLPDDTVYVGQPVWNSIGYALPATLGQGLAEPGRRPVLFVGDGAAQMTVQELSTIARAGLNPVVVLINNDGYTIERALQSPKAAYNDIAAWDWTALALALGDGLVSTRTVWTNGELEVALAEAPTDEMVLLEVVLDMFDSPPLLKELAERNGGGAQ